MASDKVRFVGEPVAICLGRTRAEAEDLAQSVVVTYDELRPLSDLSQSADPAFEPIHPGWTKNVFLESTIESGDQSNFLSGS